MRNYPRISLEMGFPFRVRNCFLISLEMYSRTYPDIYPSSSLEISLGISIEVGFPFRVRSCLRTSLEVGVSCSVPNFPVKFNLGFPLTHTLGVPVKWGSLPGRIC